MVKRLLRWLVGLIKPGIAGPLADVRLEVTDIAGKTRSHRLVKSRGKKREPSIAGICVLEKADG